MARSGTPAECRAEQFHQARGMIMGLGLDVDSAEGERAALAPKGDDEADS